MDLFIGDVHLQRIPQYFVHEMKLQLRILGEDISILGKWNSDSQIIRFQETIHISSSSSLTAARINLSFVLVALLQGQKSESRVIGSGIGFASIETLAVPQTVMLRSSNMADLMARLLFIVTFDHSEPQKSDMDYRTDSWIDLNQGSSNEFTSKVVKEGEGYDSQTRKDDLTCQKRNFRMEGGSKIRNRAAPEKVVMINTQYRQQPYRANQRESERPVAVNNCHNTSLFDSRSNQLESLQQFTERAKRKAEEKLRVIRPVSTTGIVQIVHICPNAMKENEACERLRGALDKKGEMLRRAQSQLDTNVKVSSDAKVKEICRGSAQYQHDRSLDRSDYFTTGDDRNYFKESRGESRLKQAETRRLQLLMETAHKAACRSLDATNRSISIKAAAIISNRACNKIQNAPDQRDGILKIGETHLDASVRSSISNVRSGSRNGTKADALQAARHSLELKEIRREERRALDIKSRLQSAENRRLKVLRKQKDKAAAMASEATCKAEAIKQAALNASRAYNRLRNDFDRKDEMLRRVQSELDTSTRSIRDKSYISNRLDRSSSSRYNSSTDNSPVKQRSEGGLDQSRHMRASSAPARYRGNYGPHSIPFSELKMASRPNHRERSAAPTVLTVKTVAYRQKSDSISGIRSSHVHRIPLVASGKRNVAIGSSGNDARYTLCPSHHSPRRSHSASPQRYHQSTSKPSGFSTASAANDVSIGEVDSNLNQYIRSRQRSVTDNPENIFYPCGTSSRPAGLPVTDMHMSSYTQGKLLRLVQQRIQGLKQKISEVSSSEGEVILRMIRKMLPLTSALSRPRRNGHSSLTSGPRVRKRASMSERPEMLESTAHLHSTSRERSGDTPDLLTNEIGDSTSSRTVDHEGGKETDNSEDGDDRNSEDAENINADILVAQLWDILGVTAEYGSHSKTLRDRETLQESDDSNLRRIDKAAESAKRTYDAGKELLTSKYQEIYNQHYRGYSRGGSEQADDSLHSDHYVNERSLRPPYSDITAAYSQSVADLSSNSFLRARLHLDSEGDLPQNNSSALEDDSREVIEMSSPSTEESLNVSEADSIRNGMIRNSSDVLVSETSTSSIHPSLTHSRGWAIGCSRPPLSLSVQEISTQLPKNTDQQSYENRPNEDTQSAPDDYCDDIDEEENFRGSPINVNDTSACINRQIEDVGKAINTLQARIASYMYISPDVSPGGGLLGGFQSLAVDNVSQVCSHSGMTSPVPGGNSMQGGRTEEQSQSVVKSTDSSKFNFFVTSGKSYSEDEDFLDCSPEAGHMGGSGSTASSCGDLMLGTIYGHPRCIIVEHTEKDSLPSRSPIQSLIGQLTRDPSETGKHSNNNLHMTRLHDTAQYRVRDSDMKNSLTSHLLVPMGLGNLYHTVAGSNYVDASVSVRDVDMGNISYDTMSFAADRVVSMPDVDIGDQRYTENLLKGIFGEDNESDDNSAEGEKDRKQLGAGAEGEAHHSQFSLDFESDSEDFNVIFGLS